MGMAMNQGGISAQNLYAAGAAAQPAPTPAPEAEPEVKVDGWTCPTCHNVATGKFCPECGTPKPSVEGWTCPTCGTVNKGKFCTECGDPFDDNDIEK